MQIFASNIQHFIIAHESIESEATWIFLSAAKTLRSIHIVDIPHHSTIPRLFCPTGRKFPPLLQSMELPVHVMGLLGRLQTAIPLSIKDLKFRGDSDNWSWEQQRVQAFIAGLGASLETLYIDQEFGLDDQEIVLSQYFTLS